MKNRNAITVIVLVLILGGVLIVSKNKTFKNLDSSESIGHRDSVAIYEISPSEVVEKIKNKEDIILLDVRTLEEYKEIHLQNALLLPVEELSQGTLDNIGLGQGSKDKEIIIYCRSGARSKIAHDIMKSLGYTNIKSVYGGMVHWQEDSYPFTEAEEYTENTQIRLDENKIDAPIIIFNKTTYDFGNIPKSQGVIKTIFEIQNKGNKILEIGELSTSCGCTTASISESSIEPNKKAVLTVFFDPDFHTEPVGEITRTVFIPTNDPKMPEAEVKIKVDILEDE
ncbi:hypothetical protein COW81_01105 [Candidatus Campbellbacteria bacterium CG22_combo_CG10-13_8_21_14_all_36_13]|uniref:Rhodanese domain-containing protein n=1 Tax=Candidatus Campbellbacteria bacterium CG22_combo_CG10-13_8_21_14_all_36_13 TaxID=1974529 RepID=A0A2H0E029_9BACT|nr:MAG: hypothetical protein COW81_01105 [Candidatus Campbellbacteria bacterium CG22_combo_CG10-13_8_21_14_all_36_13]